MAAAFNNQTMNNIGAAVRALFFRRKMVAPLHLTHNEYMETFVPAEAREAFRVAQQWAAPSTHRCSWDLRDPETNEKYRATLALNETVNRQPAPLIPRVLQMQPDAPHEITDRIYGWVRNGGDVSRDFGRVVKVLNMFNENYSRTAIRYYWPTILAILSENLDTKYLVNELQELRQPVKLKPLLPGLMKACRLTAETIATARLIPADIKEPEEGEVVIEITTGQYYKEEFADFHGVC